MEVNKIDPKQQLPESGEMITFVTKEPNAYMGIYKDGRFINLTDRKDTDEGYTKKDIQYWIK